MPYQLACVSLADQPVGELQSVDGYMNIALEQTKEYVEGKLRRNYGDAFVRGNNGKCLDLEGLNLLLILVVMYISAA